MLISSTWCVVTDGPGRRAQDALLLHLRSNNMLPLQSMHSTQQHSTAQQRTQVCVVEAQLALRAIQRGKHLRAGQGREALARHMHTGSWSTAFRGMLLAHQTAIPGRLEARFIAGCYSKPHLEQHLLHVCKERAEARAAIGGPGSARPRRNDRCSESLRCNAVGCRSDSWPELATPQRRLAAAAQPTVNVVELWHVQPLVDFPA